MHHLLVRLADSLTENAQLALIGMLATTIIPALVSCWLSYLAYLKSKQAVVASVKNAGAINDLHVIVNDRLTQLLASTNKASRAEGVIEGMAAPPTICHQDALTAKTAADLLAKAAETARDLILTAEALKAKVAPVSVLPPVVVPRNTEPPG